MPQRARRDRVPERSCFVEWWSGHRNCPPDTSLWRGRSGLGTMGAWGPGDGWGGWDACLGDSANDAERKMETV